MEDNNLIQRLKEYGERNYIPNKDKKYFYKGNIAFMINTLDTPDPTITIVDKDTLQPIIDDFSHLPGAEGTLAQILVRISHEKQFGGFYSFISDYSLINPQRISLRENPAICYNLRGVKNLIDHTGKPLTVCENEGRLYCSISIDPITKICNTGLKLHIPEDIVEEVSEDSSDTSTPINYDTSEKSKPEPMVFFSDFCCCTSDGRIVFIPSVGPAFRELNNFSTTISSSKLQLLLSMLLSYTDNITLLGENVKIYISPDEEEARKTIVLEKVDIARALHFSLIPLFTGLDPEIPERLKLTMTARLSSDLSQITVSRLAYPDLREDVERIEKILHKSTPGKDENDRVFSDDNFFLVPENTAGPFLLNYLPYLLQHYNIIGTEKLIEYKVKPIRPHIILYLSTGIDFLEGDASVDIDGEQLTLSDFLSQYKRNKYVELNDGTIGVLDSEYMQRLQRTFRHQDSDGNFEISFFDLPEIQSLLNYDITGEAFFHSRKIYEGFNLLKSKPLPDINVKASLRDYQKEGIKWLDYLIKNNLGGCLADDMGLGKTLQAISLLSLTTADSDLPSLVVMPKSLIFNWEKEFERFAPQIDIHIYYGPARDFKEALKHKVILTTYAMIRMDIEILSQQNFDLVILDESQSIKNVNALVTRAVLLLKARHRFALSGTPLENNLTELFSLFRFLNPTMFGTLDEFNRLYTYPIQKYGDEAAMESLRRKISPFILRRLKKDVLTELPERSNQILYVEMSEQQKRLYNARRKAYRKSINDALLSKGVEASQFMIFQALTDLRKIASVPETEDPKIESPKIELLFEQLEQSVANGHKAVVFFNFLAGIDLLKNMLEKHGIGYAIMTGKSRKRGLLVERFQNDPDCMVFLMTLKVGGTGLNLTAADTVFIAEPWWNYAAEEQAINRLHRIGQRKSVNAYKIITSDSIEEKILQLQEKKKQLFDGLIGADAAFTKMLSEEDINFILS